MCLLPAGKKVPMNEEGNKPHAHQWEDNTGKEEFSFSPKKRWIPPTVDLFTTRGWGVGGHLGLMTSISLVKDKEETMDFVGGEFVQTRSRHPETCREIMPYESIFRTSYVGSCSEDGNGCYSPWGPFHLHIWGNIC